jgi:ribonuclease BN (tRNA processing enzyme)
MPRSTRRQFLRNASMIGGAIVLPPIAQAQSHKTRLILLGTGGGPTPKKAAAATSQAILVNDVLYIVDCGNGVGRQLALANLSLSSLRHIFITHQHSDHNADYGNLFWLAWANGLGTRIDTWGPPPLTRMTQLFLEMNAADIDVRSCTRTRSSRPVSSCRTST